MKNNPFEELREILFGAESDFEKFYDEGNQVAGTRVRKAMQTLKEKAQEIRMEVQNIKNEAKKDA